MQSKDIRLEHQEGPPISQRGVFAQSSPLRKLSAIAERRKRAGIRVHLLNIGQPDLPTPPVVYDTLQSLQRGTLAYAPSNGLPAIIDGWKEYFIEAAGIRLRSEDIIVTTGGSEAIHFAMSAVCDPGDEILVFEPYYTNYNGFAALANIILRPVSLSLENGFHLPRAEAIEQRLTARTKAILLCNPNNPTGTVYSKEELKMVVDLALRHNLFLLSDEVYREFSYEEPHHSILDFHEIKNHAVLLDSTSKRFNVCGARIGVLVSRNAEIMQTVLKFAMARISAPTMEQLAVVSLLRNPEQYTKPMVDEFKRRRQVVFDGLRHLPGVRFYKPEGAFYIVVGLPVKDSEQFARWTIETFEYENETVLLAPGPGFYATPGMGLDEVRLAFMLQAEELKRSMDILRRALNSYAYEYHGRPIPDEQSI